MIDCQIEDMRTVENTRTVYEDNVQDMRTVENIQYEDSVQDIRTV